MIRFAMAVAVFLFAGNSVFATILAPEDKKDPFTGEKVVVHSIVSYGSYIYQYPSKYDLVFWPLTEESWIFLSESSGYAGFSGDFEIKDSEKEKLEAWLKENYDPKKKPKTHLEKLVWLGKVYENRETDPKFWSTYYRLMVWMTRKDKAKSLEYVRKVLPLLEKQLKDKPKGLKRIDLNYLLAEYQRRIGERERARELFEQVPKLKYVDKDGAEQTGNAYLTGLAEARMALMQEEDEKDKNKEKPDDKGEENPEREKGK